MHPHLVLFPLQLFFLKYFVCQVEGFAFVVFVSRIVLKLFDQLLSLHLQSFLLVFHCLGFLELIFLFLFSHLINDLIKQVVVVSAVEDDSLREPVSQIAVTEPGQERVRQFGFARFFRSLGEVRVRFDLGT